MASAIAVGMMAMQIKKQKLKNHCWAERGKFQTWRQYRIQKLVVGSRYLE